MSCWYLDHLIINNNAKLISIGTMAFRNCYGFQGSLTIPSDGSSRNWRIYSNAFFRDGNGGDYANRGLTSINIYPDKDRLEILNQAFSGLGWQQNGVIHVRNDSSWVLGDFAMQPGLQSWTLEKDLVI